jgi:MoxR-like ATPase
MKALVADLNKFKKHNQSRDADIDALLFKVNSMHQEILDSILEPMDYDTPNENKAIERGSYGIFFKM